MPSTLRSSCSRAISTFRTLAWVTPLLASGALAQVQFAESVKTYAPLVRDPSNAVRAADFDRDGDLDLLIGNNHIVAGEQNRLLLNDGTGTFVDATATHLPVGLWHTHGIAVGDVDGDGDLDFATGDTWQNRLFLNDGSGHFADATFGRMPVRGDETRDLVLLDLDGDSDLDLVCANYRQETLYLNDGNGFFTDVTATHLPVDAVSTWRMAATDIDGDGDVDLAFANYNSRRLYRNDGSAHFTDVTSTHWPGLHGDSSSVAFGDVDGDGDRDLFLGVWSGQSQLFVNDGSGHFTDATAGRVPATRPYHWRAAFGDLDGDLDLDLVFTTIGEDQVFLNDGTGTFQDVSASRLPRVQSGTTDVVLADLDRDGDLDLATADIGQHNRIYFNDGAGGFANATPERLAAPWLGMLALALADLDGDADLDLVAAGGDNGEVTENDTFYLNDGRGNFALAAASRLPVVADDSRALALGDVDGDGDIDIVFGNLRQQSRLLLNDGSANFTDVTAARLPVATDPTLAVVLGDVDGDGDLDLVLGNLGAPCRLYLNDGSGLFADASANKMPALVRETRALALGDLDNDGDLDLVLGNGLSRPEVESLFLNDGTGTFVDATQTRIPTSYVLPTASIALGDVDGDGDLDIAVGNDGVGIGRFNRLYLNDGTGRFVDRDLIYDYYRTFALALGDLDGDGDLDAICGDHDHYDKLYVNEGQGSFSNQTWPRMGASPNQTVAVALGDVDGDGDLDLVRGSDWRMPTLLMNHHRQIWSPRLAKVGTNWTLEAFSQAGYATATQNALAFLGAAPISLQLPPWGRLGIDPGALVALPLLSLPAPMGKAALQLAIPNVSGLVGQDFYVQALVLPTGNLADARFTNVLAERFVR